MERRKRAVGSGTRVLAKRLKAGPLAAVMERPERSRLEV